MTQLTCDAEYSQAMMIYEDNQNAIVLIKNSQFHARIKHIDIQIHFIREKVAEGFIDLAYVFTDQMIADGLTKSLARDKFVQFRAALGIE
jgi:CobQ-like glutamine amidotransferase family enzyme